MAYCYINCSLAFPGYTFQSVCPIIIAVFNTTTAAPMSVLVQSDSISAIFDYFSPPADGSKPWMHIDVDPKTRKRPQNWDYSNVPVNVENVRGLEGKAGNVVQVVMTNC